MEINIFKIQKRIGELRKILEDQRITGFMRSGYLDQISTLENQRTYVIQTVGILIPLVAVLSTLIFSYVQNERENIDFQLRNRPYLVISETESSNIVQGKSADFGLHIKNVGVLPAQVTSVAAYCSPDAQMPPREEKIIIGNGEKMIYNFSISSGLSSTNCKFSINYIIPVGSFTKEILNTEYTFRFGDDSRVLYESSYIQ